MYHLYDIQVSETVKPVSDVVSMDSSGLLMLPQQTSVCQY